MKSRKKTSRADRYVTGDGSKSAIVKRSIVISGHKTSISVEDWFWKDLEEIQASRNEGLKKGQIGYTTLSKIVGAIDDTKPKGTNLSCAIRRFIRNHFRTELENLRARAGVPKAKAA